MRIISRDLNEKIEVNKSTFIANIFYVDLVDDINLKVNSIKKKYYDARHNCYAYIIGKKNIKCCQCQEESLSLQNI